MCGAEQIMYQPSYLKKRFKLYVRLNVGIHYIAVCIYQKIIPLLNLHLC